MGTELALVAVSAAAVLSLARLFSNSSFIPPVLMAVFASHALAWACRRRGLGVIRSGLLSCAGLVLALVWLVESHTTTLGVPTTATWHAIVDDLQHAWRQFGEVKAPTPPLPGFMLASVASAWVMAAAADLFAFRMRARFEAMAPAFTLFVFGSILGAARLRLPATALYLAAVLAFVLWSEAARRSGTGAWFAGRARDGDAALLRQGAAMGLAAVVLALVLGPHVPGASSSGLVSWRDGGEGKSRSRVTVSPLVDIRGRLVDQRDVELFRVRSEAPSYWRLTSLDRFDGAIWSSLGTYQSTQGPLPGAVPGPDTVRSVRQEYTIGPLGTIWLPAAFRPQRVRGIEGARYDRDSSSLLAEADTADNLQYEVVSSLPQLTREQLVGASDAIPGEISRRYLSLPEAFPARVAAEAQRRTAGAVTPYDKARALQDWFRTDFTYDLAVDPGHDVDAMVNFLTVKRGYCEQFAGTFAAMARFLGLPARVAVGFVPGTVQADGGYLVAGRDAHAWPEVYLAGFGWVGFEPTPGRSAPGAEAYTGVSPATSDLPVSPTPTTAPGTTVVDPEIAEPEGETSPELETTAGEGGGVGGMTLLLIGGLVTLAVLAAAVPLARGWLVRRRRAAASTASERVLVAWQEAEDALTLAGHPRRVSETAVEFAVRAGPVAGPAEPELASLAGATTIAGFSPEGVPPDVVTAARASAEAVEEALRNQAGMPRRLRWALDPRPLMAAARRRP
jgi:transglutaminase-like putative cysteine protease